MFNIGSGELLVILFITLLVIGPKQLPTVARQLGRAVRILAQISNSFRREIQEMADEAVETEARERGELDKE